MGGCHSNPQMIPNNHRRGSKDLHHHHYDDNDNFTDEHSGSNETNFTPLKSFIRVGSRVFKPSKSPSLRLRLTPMKASNYNHVNELVGMQFRDMSNGTNTRINGREVGVVGLRNLGNTCFMNSSLQCLSNTIPLTDYFLGFDYRKEINRKNFLGTKGELATSYANLLKQIWLGGHSAIDPLPFKNKLEHFAPQFQGCAQHDTQEFLAFLLDGIHEDLNRVYERPYIEEKDCDGTNDEGDSMLAWSNYLRRNKSIIVDLFQGQLRNTLTCRNRQPDGTHGCGHKSVKFEPFMYLSLPISEQTSSLDDCMKLFCREEYLRGDDRWYCAKCKERVDATKKFDLWTLPPILIVHLKRFKYSDRGARSKIKTEIKYPLTDWDLNPHMTSARHDRAFFDLYATSHHVGDLGSGHYFAHALNRVDDEWYEFNDSQTRRIKSNHMSRASGSAYCLFYNRSQEDMSLGDIEYDAALRRQDSTQSGASGASSHRSPLVRRQTLERPELWPHMQVAMDDRSNHESFKNFRRGPAHDSKSFRGSNLMSLDNDTIPTSIRNVLDTQEHIAEDEETNEETDYMGDEKKCEPLDDLAPTPF